MKPRLVMTVLLALAIGGCGVSDPYNDPDDARSAASEDLPKSSPDGDLPGTVPERLRQPEPRTFPGAGTTPEDTLRRAAMLYGNWSSETAPRVFDEIVALSAGDARAQLRSVAAQARTDVQQTAAGTRSRATVEAVEVRGSGDRRRGLAVTHEHVEGDNLPELPDRYRVTVAMLERRGDRWVISEWEPQP